MPTKGAHAMLEDDLPERTRYRDTGCEIAPSCLSCPLPRCKHDIPGGLAAQTRCRRHSEIVRHWQTGAEIDDLARLYRLSRRSIYRAISARQPAVGSRHSGRPASVKNIVTTEHGKRSRRHVG
ncbi:MAG: hypothetical protein ACR2PL_02095 [Dehalococcoidia bacterium]